MMCATTNPYGIGHGWVKARFRLPIPPHTIIGDVIDDDVDEEGNVLPARVAIHADLRENFILMHADPQYRSRIAAAARNKEELAAWLRGSWDIVAGGMFNDVWSPKVHVLPRFPWDRIPRGWRIDRSYDHGQSAPFSVGWWAESNGEPLEWDGAKLGRVRGDLIRIFEWYGWNGKPNEGKRMLTSEIAKGILVRQKEAGLISRVRPGPADTSIYDETEPDRSIAKAMEKVGVRWERADKRPGSRKHGWEKIREMLMAAIPNEDGYREKPGLFVTDACGQFIRTVPVLPRDDRNLDDVNTKAEDHIADEVRYRVRFRPGVSRVSRGASIH